MENLDNFKASAAFADGEMTASLFSLYRHKEADHSDPITPRELRQAILFGDMPTQNGGLLSVLSAEARHHYQQKNGKEYNRWKGKAPAITPAVLCYATGGHKQQNIAAFTGVVMYDFDHLGSAGEARRVAQRLDEAARALLREEHGS